MDFTEASFRVVRQHTALCDYVRGRIYGAFQQFMHEEKAGGAAAFGVKIHLLILCSRSFVQHAKLNNIFLPREEGN